MRGVDLCAIVEAVIGGANWFGGRELGGRIFLCWITRSFSSVS